MSEEQPRITACRSCGQPIVFVKQISGKLAPMCVEDGVVTDVNHFSNCPDAKRFSKARRPARSDP